MLTKILILMIRITIMVTACIKTIILVEKASLKTMILMVIAIVTTSKILKERNPFKILKMGTKIITNIILLKKVL